MMTQEEKDNRYIAEIKKMVKQEVIVTDINGKKWKGVCLAVGYTHLNIVLMTETEKIIIKNILSITRKRNKKDRE